MSKKNLSCGNGRCTLPDSGLFGFGVRSFSSSELKSSCSGLEGVGVIFTLSLASDLHGGGIFKFIFYKCVTAYFGGVSSVEEWVLEGEQGDLLGLICFLGGWRVAGVCCLFEKDQCLILLEFLLLIRKIEHFL